MSNSSLFTGEEILVDSGTGNTLLALSTSFDAIVAKFLRVRGVVSGLPNTETFIQEIEVYGEAWEEPANFGFPIAGFNILSNINGTITIEDTSSGGDGTLSISISYGDGSFPTTDLIHTYSADGEYTIILSAEDEDGDIDTHTSDVVIEITEPAGDDPGDVGTPCDFSSFDEVIEEELLAPAIMSFSLPDLDLPSVDVPGLFTMDPDINFDFSIGAPTVKVALGLDIGDQLDNINGAIDVISGSMNIQSSGNVKIELAGGKLKTINDLLNSIGQSKIDFTFEKSYSYSDTAYFDGLGSFELIFGASSISLYSNDDYLYKVPIIGIKYGFEGDVGIWLKPVVQLTVELFDANIELSGTAVANQGTLETQIDFLTDGCVEFEIELNSDLAGKTIIGTIKDATYKYTFTGIGMYIGIYYDIQYYTGTKEGTTMQGALWLDLDMINTPCSNFLDFTNSKNPGELDACVDPIIIPIDLAIDNYPGTAASNPDSDNGLVVVDDLTQSMTYTFATQSPGDGGDGDGGDGDGGNGVLEEFNIPGYSMPVLLGVSLLIVMFQMRNKKKKICK